MSNIQEKLKKIKALAEQGVGGEKETAQLLYKKMLAKYSVSEAELDKPDDLKRRWFKYKAKRK